MLEGAADVLTGLMVLAGSMVVYVHMADELSSPVMPEATGRAGSRALAPQSHQEVGEYHGAPSAIHCGVFVGLAVVEAGPEVLPALEVVEVGPEAVTEADADADLDTVVKPEEPPEVIFDVSEDVPDLVEDAELEPDRV